MNLKFKLNRLITLITHEINFQGQRELQIVAAKILTSIFGVFVSFFKLAMEILFDTNTAARLRLQELELSIQGQAWLNNSGITSGDYLMEPPMFADIPSKYC